MLAGKKVGGQPLVYMNSGPGIIIYLEIATASHLHILLRRTGVYDKTQGQREGVDAITYYCPTIADRDIQSAQ